MEIKMPGYSKLKWTLNTWSSIYMRFKGKKGISSSNEPGEMGNSDKFFMLSLTFPFDNLNVHYLHLKTMSYFKLLTFLWRLNNKRYKIPHQHNTTFSKWLPNEEANFDRRKGHNNDTRKVHYRDVKWENLKI